MSGMKKQGQPVQFHNQKIQAQKRQAAERQRKDKPKGRAIHVLLPGVPACFGPAAAATRAVSLSLAPCRQMPGCSMCVDIAQKAPEKYQHGNRNDGKQRRAGPRRNQRARGGGCCFRL